MGDRILLLLFRLARSTLGNLDAKVRLLCKFFRLLCADPDFVLSLAGVWAGSSKERLIAADVCLDGQRCHRTHRILVFSSDT